MIMRAPLFAMEPNVSEKITSKWKVTPCETNVPHLLYHTLQKNKSELWKTVGQTSFKNHYCNQKKKKKSIIIIIIIIMIIIILILILIIIITIIIITVKEVIYIK